MDENLSIFHIKDHKNKDYFGPQPVSIFNADIKYYLMGAYYEKVRAPLRPKSLKEKIFTTPSGGDIHVCQF